MRIISGTISGASHLARLQLELSKKARQRLKWFDYYNSRSHNASTAAHFLDTQESRMPFPVGRYK